MISLRLLASRSPPFRFNCKTMTNRSGCIWKNSGGVNGYSRRSKKIFLQENPQRKLTMLMIKTTYFALSK